MIDSVMPKNAQEHRDVGKIRHILERKGSRRQERRNHQRQGRILGARNSDASVEPLAADDANPVQGTPHFAYSGCSLL
jgi:hypothetical protein